MPWDMRPVGTEFLDTAPYRFTAAETVDRPAEAVFAAIADDPAGWGDWFPGFSHGGRWLTPPPHGPGSRRRVRMAGVAYDERILVWDRPHRWTFRVEQAGAPLAYALVEDYRVAAVGDGRCRVQWTFALDPRGALRRGPARLGTGRFDPVLAAVFRRAMSGLGAVLGSAGPGNAGSGNAGPEDQ